MLLVSELNRLGTLLQEKVQETILQLSTIYKRNIVNNYDKLAGFGGVYLEDSFVINISESDTKLAFTVEFVLTEAHPLFTPPKIGEQYCYLTGKLLFTEISSVNWKEKSNSCFHDANDEVDYGNIDIFRKCGEHRYEISGDWGDLEIVASRVEIVFS